MSDEQVSTSTSTMFTQEEIEYAMWAHYSDLSVLVNLLQMYSPEATAELEPMIAKMEEQLGSPMFGLLYPIKPVEPG